MRPSGRRRVFLWVPQGTEESVLWVASSTWVTFLIRPAKLSLPLFSRVGTVESARIMRDMATGRARGFGFVEMASDEEAQTAISELNEFKMEGRPLVVNEARPKPMGGGGGAGGGFERGNRGGGGGGGGRREPRW